LQIKAAQGRSYSSSDRAFKEGGGLRSVSENFYRYIGAIVRENV